LTIDQPRPSLKLRPTCPTCGQTESPARAKIINDFSFQAGIFMGAITRPDVQEFLESKNFSIMKRDAIISLLKDLSKVFYE